MLPGAAMVLLGPFVPLLFAGEEFAVSSPFQYFTDFQDKELGRLVSEGRRKEFLAFGWPPDQIPDPQSEETFLRSKLRWEDLSKGSHAEMLDWYRQLIALRHEESVLTRIDLRDVEVRFDQEQQWFWMTRGPIDVAFNAGRSEVTLAVARSYSIVLASCPEIKCGADHLRLPARSVAVLRDRNPLRTHGG